MQKILYLLVISLIIVFVGNITIEANSDSMDLDQMSQVLENKDDVKIEEWSVTAREATTFITTERQFLLELRELKTKLPSFTWNVMKSSTKYIAVGMRDESDFHESITLSSTLSSQNESYITYEIKGNTLKGNWKQNVSNLLNSRKKIVFNQNTTFFTCIKGSFNDTIDKVLTSVSKKWMESFHAREVESLQEENFISITAQSSLFKQTDVSKHYNFQLAMRNDGMGARTTFVIGTPIITFEY
ncbi:YwmB family TATA-box binding protein [Bacillus massiliigorillae]|uniref:YwmB family TATA-box binding protein n=1 Tax=Bacillus massiliigorillae TaxID=1243664 RepID=UPI0003A88D98|nr:YwmB family TATA-box binding protein [Bacillus massiliigorillae]